VCPSEPISGSNELPVCVKSCLAAFRKHFKVQESAETEYQNVVPVQTQTLLPHRSLPLASLPSQKFEWIVARVTDFAHGKPSSAFQLVSLASSPLPSSSSPSCSSSPSPCVRLRLYSSFVAFRTKLVAVNLKVPQLPSDWRVDQRVLQRELDAWLYDVTQLIEPSNDVLAAFLNDASDTFQHQDMASSSSLFSFAYVVMGGKPYVPLFSTPLSPSSPSKVVRVSGASHARVASPSANTSISSSSSASMRSSHDLASPSGNVSSMLSMLNTGLKPITLLVGASGSSKSAFVNHIIGFPVCDPMGASHSTKSLVATFYEVIPPADYAAIAQSESYWTHPNQFHLASYSKDGSSSNQSILVDIQKLQEPIHRLETSWKQGWAIHLLDHQQTLERYLHCLESASLASSVYGTLLFRTCLINEASLDPIRQEYEIARNNVFVELNNFNLENVHVDLASSSLASSFAAVSSSTSSSRKYDIASSLRSVLQDTLSSSSASNPQTSHQSLALGTHTSSNACLVGNDPRLISQLLEVSMLRQDCHRLLYFVSFDQLEKCVEEYLLLEITEMFCMSKDSYQFSQTLTTWIQQCTSYENKIDLLKLLGLMKHWTNLLPTPRRFADLLFLTPERIPDDSLHNVCQRFKIHDIMGATGYLLLTKDSSQSTLPNASSTSLSASKLSVSLSPSSTAGTANPVYDYIIDTEMRSVLFETFTPQSIQSQQLQQLQR